MLWWYIFISSQSVSVISDCIAYYIFAVNEMLAFVWNELLRKICCYRSLCLLKSGLQIFTNYLSPMKIAFGAEMWPYLRIWFGIVVTFPAAEVNMFLHKLHIGYFKVNRITFYFSVLLHNMDTHCLLLNLRLVMVYHRDWVYTHIFVNLFICTYLMISYLVKINTTKT